MNLDFESLRAFSKTGSPPYCHEGGKLREIGTSMERVRPLDNPKLFEDFVGLDSPDAYVKFATVWGLLTVEPHETMRAEPIKEWQTKIRSMRKWIGLLRSSSVPFGRAWSRLPAEVMPGIRLEGGDGPVLVFRPKRLVDALWLQLARFVAQGGAVLTCEECGKDFGVGAKKRADARFCGDTCRFRFHNKRRAGK
jgi:hypothetical protein